MEVLRKTQEDLTSGQSQLDTMSQTINKETVSTGILRQAVLYYFTEGVGCSYIMLRGVQYVSVLPSVLSRA